MSAVDLLTRRGRFEILQQRKVIGEVYVINPRHIVIEPAPKGGLLVRRGKRGA